MIVPNHHQLVTASEPVTRPDISSGSISTLEMTADQIERARERETNKTIGFTIERKDDLA